MKLERALLVAAVVFAFPGGADAQMCSGGPAGGGADATGNECSWTGPANDDVDDVLGKHLSAAMALRSSPAPGAATVASGGAGAPASATTNSFDRRPAPHPCSGGADGGMDATGNGCASWLEDGAGDIDSLKWG